MPGTQVAPPRENDLAFTMAADHCDDFVRHVYCCQGMSIVAGVDILVEASEFSFTQGACPQAGIDIEPSSEAEPLHNITLRDLVIMNKSVTACAAEL